MVTVYPRAIVRSSIGGRRSRRLTIARHSAYRGMRIADVGIRRAHVALASSGADDGEHVDASVAIPAWEPTPRRHHRQHFLRTVSRAPAVAGDASGPRRCGGAGSLGGRFKS